jgi:hypothetical protein
MPISISCNVTLEEPNYLSPNATALLVDTIALSAPP